MHARRLNLFTGICLYSKLTCELVMCPGTLPPVQRAVLTLLPSLVPSELPQLWPDLIQLHLNLLQPQQLPPQGMLAPGAPEGHVHANVNKHALTALSMEKTAEMLAALYRYG